MSEVSVEQLLSLQERLNFFIQNPSQLGMSREIFLEYTSLLKRSIYRPYVIKKDRYCQHCSSLATSSSLLLPCGHLICSKGCFQEIKNMIMRSKIPGSNCCAEYVWGKNC